MDGNLSIKEIHERLSDLKGWEMGFDTIHKVFEFDNFKKAIDFVNKVAEESEKMNHHPEIRVIYKRVNIILTTHDANGITLKDFKLAKIIEEL